VADEKHRAALDSARRRGEEFGKHHWRGGTIHPFPSRSRIERQLRAYLVGDLDLTDLDREKIAACYEAARETYERRRQEYLDAIKAGDVDTVKQIEDERDEHSRRLREHMHAPKAVED